MPFVVTVPVIVAVPAVVVARNVNTALEPLMLKVAPEGMDQTT